MDTRSKDMIEHWESILDLYKPGGKFEHKTSAGYKTPGIERLSSYLCSITLGREFGQKSDEHIEQKGLTEFFSWAENIIH